MASLRMTLLDLLNKSEQGADPNFLRDGVQLLAQELMDAEVTDLVGAEPHQRTILEEHLPSTINQLGRCSTEIPPSCVGALVGVVIAGSMGCGLETEPLATAPADYPSKCWRPSFARALVPRYTLQA